MKEIKIEVPKGFTAEIINGEIVLKKNPTKWEDIESLKGYRVDDLSRIQSVNIERCKEYRNTFATKEQAEASIALAQISQLMRLPEYNGDKEIDWEDGELKYVICVSCNFFTTKAEKSRYSFLAFKTRDIADKFLKNNLDLIKQAKPLL